MINLNKIYKSFFYIFFSIILSFFIIITFNTKARDATLFGLVNAYKNYMSISMQIYLKKPEPDLKKVNKKLLSFINLSKKISSGKSRILIGIYDATNLVQSNITNEADFSYLEESFSELVKLDPGLYEGKIWYAKTLYANNKFDEALKQINKAIKISSLEPEPYRLGIKIAHKLNNNQLLNLYCNNYLTSKLGGKQKRYQLTKFSGFNLSKFGVKLNPSRTNNTYLINGIATSKIAEYEVIPDKIINLESVDLIFNFIPGTILEFFNLKLYSKDKIYLIDNHDLFISAKEALFDNNKTTKIVFMQYNTEVVSMKLKKTFENIDKIILSLNFKKLNLTNKNCNF
jgi:hypothetical protein